MAWLWLKANRAAYSELARRFTGAPELKLISHLFLHFLIDPDAGVDRTGSLLTDT